MRRGLRWSCHAVVLTWSVALLVQQTAVVSAKEPRLAARVTPVPEQREPETEQKQPELAETQPDPVAVSEPPPVPEPQRTSPAPTRVSARDFSRGSSLLDGGGAFPALSFGYDEFPSFVSYARAMVDLGARFVVVRNRQIVGSVDLDARDVGTQPLGAGFSPRARDYTSEPGLASIAASARERFGGGSVVMMLVPRPLDAGLFGGLARVLSEHGEPHAGLREVRGSYRRAPGGGVRLHVDRAVRRDGTPVGLQAVFDLHALARGVNS